MKHNSISLGLMVLALLTLAACGGRNTSTPAAETTSPDEKVQVSVCSESDCVEVIGITDREGEQSVDLFRGQDDPLLDSLLSPGQTAFRSAFNVYIAHGLADYDDTVTHTVLFDAGIGPQAGGRLPEGLASVGIEPADIEAVCLTHLHFDHLGWLLDSAGALFFPNADIYLSEAEMASGRDNERWQQVLAAYGDRVKTFADGESICFDMVRTHVVPGHTPGHTVYKVGPCLIVGDLLHAQDLQLRHPDFCARYDADPDKARQVRKNIYEMASKGGGYLCGAHCYEHFIDFANHE